LRKVQYSTQQERDYLLLLLTENEVLIEEANISEGNFLIIGTADEIPQAPSLSPTAEEQIQILKEQQARMDADMAAFMDYVLGGM
jgi:hypothetical protein